jgi:hypothetical protein
VSRRTTTSGRGRSIAGSKRAGAAGASAVRPSAAKTTGTGPRTKTKRAGTAGPPPLPFWSREWAQAAKAAVNDGPSPEARAKKIERFWEWIDKAKQHVDCQLALAVEGLPGGGARNCLVLDLEHGRCARARLATRDDAEATATYLLTGSYADWREIMAGFDMGKAVMYRKLLLEKGEVLEFFKSVYYWTESLACIQRIPTSFPTTGVRAN